MFPDRPVVCLVTDRRRLVDPLAPYERARDRLIALARDAAAAGVSLIQIRERDLEAAQLGELAAAIVDVTRGSATRVVVNDRLDVALASGADGVHLRADSISPGAARVLAPPPFLIGRSVHDLDEARVHAASADYLIAGTMFPTTSKAAATRYLSEADFRDMVAAVSVPILAVGGITMDRLAQVAGTGAAGFAAIGLFLPTALPTARPLGEIVQAARARFALVDQFGELADG